jgi:hypothetical protein
MCLTLLIRTRWKAELDDQEHQPSLRNTGLTNTEGNHTNGEKFKMMGSRGFVFLGIKGEHLLNANWPVQTAINTDRMVCNAIQPVRRCTSAINKKHV